MTETRPPDYESLTRLLAETALAPSPAEAQGMLCGLLAARVPDAGARWLAQLGVPADAESAETDTAGPAPDGAAAGTETPPMLRAELEALAFWSLEPLESAEGSVALLLPDDDRPLRERAGAVIDWIRGLLFGLGLAGIRRERLEAEAREALDDLLELTRMDLDAIAGDEAEEDALGEIVEFARVAAMLLREDEAHARPAARGGAPPEVE